MLYCLHLLLWVLYHRVTAKADGLVGTAEAVWHIFAEEARPLVGRLEVVALACGAHLEVLFAEPVGEPACVDELCDPNRVIVVDALELDRLERPPSLVLVNELVFDGEIKVEALQLLGEEASVVLA